MTSLARGPDLTVPCENVRFADTDSPLTRPPPKRNGSILLCHVHSGGGPGLQGLDVAIPRYLLALSIGVAIVRCVHWTDVEDCSIFIEGRRGAESDLSCVLSFRSRVGRFKTLCPQWAAEGSDPSQLTNFYTLHGNYSMSRLPINVVEMAFAGLTRNSGLLHIWRNSQKRLRSRVRVRVLRDPYLTAQKAFGWRLSKRCDHRARQ
jgi:hypothetical protein